MSETDFLEEIIPGLRGPGTHVASDGHQRHATFKRKDPPRRLGKAQVRALKEMAQVDTFHKVRQSVGDRLCEYGFAVARRFQSETWYASGSVSIQCGNRYKITASGRERLRSEEESA